MKFVYNNILLSVSGSSIYFALQISVRIEYSKEKIEWLITTTARGVKEVRGCSRVDGDAVEQNHN